MDEFKDVAAIELHTGFAGVFIAPEKNDNHPGWSEWQDEGIHISADGGELWPVNALVNVDIPWLRLSGEMLISELTHTLDDSGTQTQLTLRRPDAFIPQPAVPADADPLALI